jgi:TolB-like protein/class 3 adenylate cyclase
MGRAQKERKTGKAGQHHQLAAIMFTDIQGYTALMQEDEELAIKIRAEHRKIFKSTTQKYNGEILQYYGDGTLSIFDSAIDAVKCGIEMQLEFPIPVRIGIHSGDIIYNDEEIIGDGVNIASRIESLAVVGSVFVSGKVYDDIKNQKSIQTKLVGSFALKNIKDPVDVYAISNDGLVVPFSNQIEGEVKEDKKKIDISKAHPISKSSLRKYLLPGVFILLLLTVALYYLMKGGFGDVAEIDQSVAILPLTNLSEDSQQDYFSDGMTEEMITQLSKIGDLKVISRTSVMGYKNTTVSTRDIARQLGVGHVLTGSVRKNGDQLRISAQLIDAKTDKYIWANTFDRNVDDVFAIQSEVAFEVAKALKAELTKEEKDGVNAKPTENAEAHELYLQGLYHLRTGSMEGLEKSFPLLQEAIKKDQEFAEAYSEIAMYYIRQGTWTGKLTPDIAREQALPYVEKALELDPGLKTAIIRSGIIKWFFEWDFEGAEKEFMRGESASDHGFFLLLMGRFQEAEEHFAESFGVDPLGRLDRPHRGIVQYYLDQPDVAIKILKDGISFQPDVADSYHKLGKIYLNTGKYDEAIEILKQGIVVSNGRVPSLLSDLAIAYFNKDQLEETFDIIDELKSLEALGPQGSPAFSLGQIYAGMGDSNQAFEWLEKSYEAHEVEMIWLKIEPQFKSIWNDPRFVDLMERVGFPQ